MVVLKLSAICRTVYKIFGKFNNILKMNFCFSIGHFLYLYITVCGTTESRARGEALSEASRLRPGHTPRGHGRCPPSCN